MHVIKLFATYYPPKTVTHVYVTLAAAENVLETGFADIDRSIRAPESVESDMVRSVTDKAIVADFSSSDLIRCTTKKEIVDSAIIRGTGADSVEGDLLRIIASGCYGMFPLVRLVTNSIHLESDMVRIVGQISEADSDTSRILSAGLFALKPLSVEITLQKGTISDLFHIQLAREVHLGDCIRGKILDFPYTLYAYEIDETGLIRKVTGMYDIDRLLYTPFTYISNSSMTAKDHAKSLAKILGKYLAAYFDDFIPSDSYAGTGATVQNLAGSLFGWAGNLPQRWINVFIRENTLYIIQRGKEPNHIDITDTKHTRPEINRKLMRSVWSGKGSGRAHNQMQLQPIGFTGTIRFGEAECTYRYGYLVSSVIEMKDGTETTTYSYDYDGYIVSKSVESNSYSVQTTYSYANTGGDKYLATEETVTTDKRTNQTSTQRVQHVYLGNGFYGTAHYTDEILDSSSVSSGKPGSKASRFVIDQSNLGLGGNTAHYPKEKDNRFTSALFDTEFPIANTSMLEKLTNDIEWLDRKTEETVSMDIWQYPHVIDFTDRITFQGAAYSLESNHIVQTPTEIKQSVVLKRWY